MSSRPLLSAQGLIKMLSFINCYLEVKDETVIYKKTLILFENTTLLGLVDQRFCLALFTDT